MVSFSNFISFQFSIHRSKGPTRYSMRTEKFVVTVLCEYVKVVCSVLASTCMFTFVLFAFPLGQHQKMVRYSRSKGRCAKNRQVSKKCLKTKRYKKDVDQILDEIKKEITSPSMKRPYEMVDELPANGQFMCVQCEYVLFFCMFVNF